MWHRNAALPVERSLPSLKTIASWTPALFRLRGLGIGVGLSTGRTSADSIHLYHGNAALLAESLEVIQKASAVILSALETPAVDATATEAEDEAEPKLAQAS